MTLRRVRLRSGLSLRALAARADTSHSTLSAYEAGRKVPTVETLDRIVRAAGFELGVELTPAVGGADREARGPRARRGARARRAVPRAPRDEARLPGLPPGVVSALVDKILALHAALDDADIPHAFGGALALAWCTQRARGTIDIDVNVFVDRSRTPELLAALPAGVRWSDDDRARIERDGQVAALVGRDARSTCS